MDFDIKDKELAKLEEKGFRYRRPNTKTISYEIKEIREVPREIKKEEPKEKVEIPEDYFSDDDRYINEVEEEPLEPEDYEPEEIEEEE